MKIKSPLKLLASLLIPQLAGGLGAIFTSSAIPQWYAELAKPAFTPPSWVFGPVWTTLYLMMGIALYIVWSKPRPTHLPLLVFALQITLNALWSVLFFGLREPGFALIEITLLWGAILWNILVFWRVSRTAASLLIPYLLWVSFATALNYGIWALNCEFF